MSIHIHKPYAPIEKLELDIAVKKNIQVYLKREDYSHPFISGNKWRKLKYHLLEAERQEKRQLVSFGGAYSNHLLATAAAAAKYKFNSYAFVRGEKVDNQVLKLCALFGMHIHFVSRTAYQNKEELYHTYFGSNPNAFYIPEGGSGELGEKGVSEIMQEPEMQTFDVILASVGTGGTLKGLIKGVAENKLNSQVHGIVVLKGAEQMKEEYAHFNSNSYQLHFQYHGGGYAKHTAELVTFQNKFASQTGILLDLVYEAKMMWALINLIEADYFKPGTKLCALHNGGTVGILSS
jgi:1-aminocyclopropane-1-carboxylate deaminase